MAKRLTDTTIWKKQRWFKKLSPVYKLAWKYITDMCDHAGILKIDFSELTEDLGLEDFDMKDFINQCNQDFDKHNGKKIQRDRIKLIKENIVWITGFIRFQYENKDLMINPRSPAIYAALTVLNSYGTLQEGLDKGYYTLSQPYIKGMLTTKDRDIDNSKGSKPLNGHEKSKEDMLIKSMIEVWKRYNPVYPVEKDEDYPACLQIAYKIADTKGWRHVDIVGVKENDLINSWGNIVKFVSSDSFYKKFAIKNLPNQYQAIFKAMQSAASLNGNSNKPNSKKRETDEEKQRKMEEWANSENPV